MGKVTIRKESATRFEVAADGIGIVTGVQQRWTKNGNVVLKMPDGDLVDEYFENYEVFDLEATESSEFSSLQELLDIFETIGFANFKTGEAAPDLSLYQPENRGNFTGVFHLNRYADDFYDPLVQTANLPLSIDAGAIVGGIAKVKITANGSAITGYGTWIRQSSDDITTTNGAVMDLIVQKTPTEIHYSVKIR